MLAPLLFSEESPFSRPRAISSPVLCGVCRGRGRRGLAAVHCPLCPRRGNRQFLCRDCDAAVHRPQVRRRHRRRLLVLGSGLHKKTLFEGDVRRPVQPLDRVRVSLSTLVFRTDDWHREPRRELHFIAGSSGDSLHLQVTGLSTSPLRLGSSFLVSLQYCGRLLGLTRPRRPEGVEPGRVRWEAEAFVLPLRAPPPRANNILRVQVFELVSSRKVCRGQTVLSLGRAVSLARSSEAINSIALPLSRVNFVGRLSCSAGLGRSHLYLRVDSFQSYLLSSYESQRFSFVVSHQNGVRQRLKVSQSVRMKISSFLDFVDTKESSVAFCVLIYCSGHLLGEQVISVDDYLSMVVEASTHAAEVTSIDDIKAHIRTSVPERDMASEREAIERAELGDQWVAEDPIVLRVEEEFGEESLPISAIGSHGIDSQLSHRSSRSRASSASLPVDQPKIIPRNKRVGHIEVCCTI